MLTPRAHLAGKPVFTYPTMGRRTMPGDLRALLKKHPARHTLRQLGEIGGKQWASPHDGFRGGAPIPPHAIPYLALLAIESSNDHRGSPMTEGDLRRVGQVFMDLVEPASQRLAEDPDAPIEVVLRLSRQFEFQGELRHQLPRIVLLLRDIWPTVEKARAISPCDELVRLTGLTLDQLLLFGWSFCHAGIQGWFRPYTEGAAFKQFSIEAQAAFLRWASADYKMIRQLAEEERKKLTDETLDPYRFNPLLRFPLVRPDVQPNPKLGEVYLLPCHRWLFARVHGGLYHLLADHHRGEGSGENPFRVAFGHVFQEYVGELLKKALGGNAVFPERQYRESGSDLDTVDWIVIEGDAGVLLEVKQASLSFQARGLGDLRAARKDLAKSVVKAVRQLNRTEAAIRAGVRGLEDLSRVREFERLVVTYDTIPFANSLLRDLASRDVGANAPHVHACSIDEFEYILGRCPTETFHGFLRRKRLGPEGQDMLDMKEWLAYEDAREMKTTDNPFMTGKYRELMGAWGVP